MLALLPLSVSNTWNESARFHMNFLTSPLVHTNMSSFHKVLFMMLLCTCTSARLAVLIDIDRVSCQIMMLTPIPDLYQTACYAMKISLPLAKTC